MKLAPKVKLEKDETIEYTFRRSAILNVLIIAGEILATFAFIAFLIYLSSLPSLSNLFLIDDNLGRSSMYLITSILYVVIIIAGLISLHVNRSNVLFITNRRLIQTTTTTLIAESLNIISLKNVEDVSFKQTSLLDRLFHLGQLRLSTVGDETTYTFPHIDAPSDEALSQLSHLISKFKEDKE